MNPITRRFPKRWRLDVKVLGNARDPWGDVLTPAAPRVIKDCMFAPNTSNEGDLTDVPEDRARLLAPPGTQIPSTATIEVPGFGTYTVAGTPNAWPMGLDIQLERKGTRHAD